MIVPIICLIIIIFCIVAISKGVKEGKKINDQKQELFNSGATILASFNHFNGLPIAEGALCQVVSFPDKLKFKSGGIDFDLEKNKITDICIKSEAEIQQQYVSSVGGAVGGAVLFGPIGAMIGGRAKKKTTKTITSYMIITYMKDEEVKYIAFDILNQSSIANRFVKEFKDNNIQGQKTISL